MTKERGVGGFLEGIEKDYQEYVEWCERWGFFDPVGMDKNFYEDWRKKKKEKDERCLS